MMIAFVQYLESGIVVLQDMVVKVLTVVKTRPTIYHPALLIRGVLLVDLV